MFHLHHNLQQQGGAPINKFPKPMFWKHHAHFELPKVKVSTIKLLHDFQRLHLKIRHFEHKSYKKHYLKRSKNFGRNLWHLWCFKQLEDLSITHLKHSMNGRTLSHTLSQTSKLKFSTTQRTLFPKHFHLEIWCFQKTWRTLEKLTSLWKNLFRVRNTIRF